MERNRWNRSVKPSKRPGNGPQSEKKRTAPIDQTVRRTDRFAVAAHRAVARSRSADPDPVAVNAAGERIQQSLSGRAGTVDTVTLSVFENFPNVSVKLSGGEIISHAFAGLPDSLRTRIPAAADTLLKFDEFSVSLNLPQLLASAHFDPPDRPDAAESLCLRLPVGQSQLGNLRGGHDGRRLHGAGRRPIPEHRRPGHSQQRTNRVRQQARQAVRYGRPGAPAA